MKTPKLLGFHAQVPLWLKIMIGMIPIIIVMAIYSHYGEIHRFNNPDSMLMPSVEQIKESIVDLTMEPESKRKTMPKLWADTLASMTNLLLGMLISALIALGIGLHYGLYRGLDGMMGPITTVIGFIPPILAVPIVIATMGKDDAGKITLIVLGMTFVMAGNLKNYVKEIPREFLVKTETLNASSFGVLYRTYLPLLFPRLIAQLMNNVGVAWVMLFTAEFVAASQGLGYRVYLMRRWLDMSVIVPYMLWIALLSFIMLYLLRKTNEICSPWYGK